jgi:cytochrome c peroxidase
MKRILAVLLFTACTTPPPAVEQSQEDLTLDEAAHIANGGVLFATAKFGGNDRVCSTCHRLEPGQRTTLTPAFVQAVFTANPNDPLFRTKDSDNGAGTSYTLLKRDATVRIPFTLPANVQVLNPSDGVNVQHMPDGTTKVWVRRSTPTINNIFAETADAPASTVPGFIMWDGREGTNLAQQAIDAVNTHADPTVQPTAGQASDIALFQKDLFFSSLPLAFYANGAAAPTLPPGTTDSQIRGRAFFVDSGPIDANHRGLCATCHGGPMLNTTTSGNPVQPAGMRFTNNLVSETNSGSLGLPPLGHGYPELVYAVTLQHDVVMPFPFSLFIPNIPAGTQVALPSSDPGRVLTTGDPCELPLNCGLNPGGFLSLFKIPTLWGAASTAPYFHDNSAADIHAAMERYVLLFGVTAAGLNNPAFVISDQDRADIEAYFTYAFR